MCDSAEGSASRCSIKTRRCRLARVADFLGDDWEVAAVATSLEIQPLLERRTDELSGGQAKRVALTRALVGEFDLILLDEPTNHLDLEAIEWLEQRLGESQAALVVITHDRHLMDRLTTARGEGRVLELEQGSGYVHRASAGESAYAAYLEGRAARHEQAAGEESTRRILARRELAWLRRGAPARSTKPKARLRSATEIVAGGPASAGLRANELVLDVGTTRLGNQVVELLDVSQSYGAREVLHGVDLLIEPGARLGVVGPNGSGKSTLLDIVAGRALPAAGTVKRGSTVVTGYADQQTTLLDPDAVVRELVAGPTRQPDWEDRVLLERFWFDSTAQYAPVRMLSGGERRRLQLVMVLATKPNLLVLDEPTNDLDLDTLRALEGFLDEWPGALVVASHDRTFLDRTIDHVLAIAADGSVSRVPGGVQGWLAGRTAQQGRAPTRTKAASGPIPLKSRAPSQYTIGRQIRDTEQAMARAQRSRRSAPRTTGGHHRSHGAGHGGCRAGCRPTGVDGARTPLARARRATVGLSGRSGLRVAGGTVSAMTRAAIGMCFDRTFPAGAVSEYARQLESAGVEQLWLIEDCFYTAGVSLAATALAVTERLEVGIGILPAVARNPAITAMEIATLCNLAPGRFRPGIGHGVQSWMGQMGARTPSPLTTLDETITVVKRLLSGDDVTFDGRVVHLDGVRLDQPPSIVPPVVAGVQQAKSLAIAGRVADGVILVEGAGPTYVEWALEQAGRRDRFRGRDVHDAEHRWRPSSGVPPADRVRRRPGAGATSGVHGAAVLRRDAAAGRVGRARVAGRDAGRLLDRDRRHRHGRRRPRPRRRAGGGGRRQHQHLPGSGARDRLGTAPRSRRPSGPLKQ